MSLFLPIVPDLFVLFSLLLLSIIFLFSYKLSKPLHLSSGVIFGATWMLFNAASFEHQWQDNNLNTSQLAAKAHWLQGEVLSLQSTQEHRNTRLNNAAPAYQRLRFNFQVTHINEQPLAKAIILRLSWKNASLALFQGQKVKLKVKFKPAHGLANLGSFSYQTWLNSKGISGTGYVINHKNNQWLNAQRTVRQTLFTDYKKNIFHLSADHELAPLLLALGFGSRSELTPELWNVLQATGTGHLIAISGLHIGLVATGSYFFVMLFFRVLPLHYFTWAARLQVVNIRYVAIAISIVIAMCYGYLAGFSLPTVRALVMLNLYWCTRLLAIRLSIKRWVLLTLFLLTLTSPFSLFTASFWLSVYAVMVILLTLWRFKHIVLSGGKLWRFIKGLLIIQLALTLMLLPISAVFFQQISCVSLLANIIAVPWMSFFSIPLCLLSILLMPISVDLSQFCLMLSLGSLQVLWNYLYYLSTFDWAVLTLASIHIQRLVLAGILTMLLLYFQPKFTLYRLKNLSKYPLVLCIYLIVVLVLPLTALTDTRSSSTNGQSTSDLNQWQLVVFDVGQGLSVLIKRQHHAILYDTGAAYASGFNMVDAVILPYLQHEGIQQLDKVIISHSDNDHAGGIDILQQSIPIAELLYNAAENKGENTCQQGKSFKWQGLQFEMLWPEKVISKENDDSCVIHITDGKHSVLLTGDISTRVEAKLLAQYPQLQVDVLLVPHHGSKTSSSDLFIKHLRPNLAVVSAGFLNRWQMPMADIVHRYQIHGIPLLNTAETGQIIVNFSQNGITQQTYRHQLWPFWFANSL
ncbi:MAG: DNA internalization-related competence protein ComEC/Rec2 [Colwellia sp.]|nr:DNA internalization-related competence protein ComEC/Rec2 [Colwellia sp.]MCW9080899.1 DNA internalization-related competence protein ComEC/Rec2 [Colwellia sp.]